MKKILFVTIDPIEHRRRVLNQIEAAKEAGYHVEAVSLAEFGKKYGKETDPCPIRRIYLPVDKGPLKFILFNIILFFMILFKHYAVIHARGLWTMPAVFKYLLVHRCRIIYDAHEFFAGHQIFQKRPVRKSIWMLMERIAMPFVDTLLTISGPLADEYKKRYPRLKNVQVIRNLPSIKDKAPDVEKEYPRKDEPFTFLFHGYFHEGRALEQTLSAFQNLKDLQVRVILIGKGPLENRLKDLVHREKLDHFVKFVDFIPNNELINYIRHADTALVLIQADSVNRSYSLPNKFFESVMAGLPVLASNIPTLKKYIEKYELGLTVDPDDPYAISEAMRKIYFEQDKLNTWRKNCLAAADELNWENEAEKMKEIYLHIFD